jgi:hypothetical protein
MKCCTYFLQDHRIGRRTSRARMARRAWLRSFVWIVDCAGRSGGGARKLQAGSSFRPAANQAGGFESQDSTGRVARSLAQSPAGQPTLIENNRAFHRLLVEDTVGPNRLRWTRGMNEPEKLVPLHGGYRKLKSFQVAQLALSESRTLAALLSGELRGPAAAQLVEANA